MLTHRGLSAAQHNLDDKTGVIVCKAAPPFRHSQCEHIHLPPTQLEPADERNADVVFDLVLGKHGRDVEDL